GIAKRRCIWHSIQGLALRLLARAICGSAHEMPRSSQSKSKASRPSALAPTPPKLLPLPGRQNKTVRHPVALRGGTAPVFYVILARDNAKKKLSCFIKEYYA